MQIRSLIPRWFAVMIMASLAIVGYGLVHTPSDTEEPASPPVAAQSELLDVMWLDRAPEMAHDPWRAYIFTNENVGLSIDAKSSYKLVLELFEFKADSRKITFHFPHDARKAGCGYKIEKMKKPTKYFDTQLTIDNDPQNGGTTMTYFTGPDFRSASRLPLELHDCLESHGLLQYLPE